MANIDIVDKAIKKLTEEEFIHLKDWILLSRIHEEKLSYAKGYNTGKKFVKVELGGTDEKT